MMLVQLLVGVGVYLSVQTWGESSTHDITPNVCIISQFCEPPEVGLGATLMKVIGQVVECRMHGHFPLVHWDPHDRDNYCPPSPKNAKNSHDRNCWTGLFASSSIALTSASQAFCLNEKNSFWLDIQAPRTLGKNQWLRSFVAETIAPYLKLAPDLQRDVESFRKQHFTGYTMLGVQVRGGQGALEYGQHAQPLKMYTDEAKRVTDSLGDAKKVRFFVASNTAEAADAFRAVFGTDAVVTSDATVIRTAEDDLDNGNGIKCGGDGQQGCASSNSRGVIMDVLLLSACDHYVYWRGSTSLVPLLISSKLHAHWVGPPLTEVDPKTEFGSEEGTARREEYFREWSITEKEMNDVFHREYNPFHHKYDPDYVLEIPVFGCPVCDDAIKDYGMSPFTPDSWAEHAALLAAKRRNYTDIEETVDCLA